VDPTVNRPCRTAEERRCFRLRCIFDVMYFHNVFEIITMRLALSMKNTFNIEYLRCKNQEEGRGVFTRCVMERRGLRSVYCYRTGFLGEA
jgi:hypothetical protein